MRTLLGIVLSIVTGLPALAANPDRDAYFGETHVHTSWSLDAFAIGNLLTNPGDAYKYFKGEPIKHPLGFDVKIDTPLDWAGVTDHSEYAGVVNLANEPGSPVSKLPAAQPLILKARTKEEMERVVRELPRLVRLLGELDVPLPDRSGDLGAMSALTGGPATRVFYERKDWGRALEYYRRVLTTLPRHALTLQEVPHVEHA